jgi:hypothetical protein
MDLTYGLADYQTWRTNWTYWTENNTPQLKSAPTPISYIELGSGAVEEIPPPETFGSVTMRFMPLAADPAVLEDLIQRYLGNQPDIFEFTLRIPSYGPIVYLILSNFEQMKTVDLSGVVWPNADREMTFAIPVTWTNKNTGTTGDGLIPAYTFAGTYWNTITTSEVYGRLTLKSDFVSPPFENFFPPPLLPDGNLSLSVETELFPNTSSSQELQELPLVDFYTIYPPLPPGSAPIQTGQVTDDFLETMGLDQQFGTDSIDFFTIGLKQIRDANDPTKADYQAPVFLGRRFEQDGSGFFPVNIDVHFYNYPNLSLVQSLGLTVAREYQTIDEGGDVVTVLVVHAVKPLFLHGTITSISADIGWWRIGNLTVKPWPMFDP